MLINVFLLTFFWTCWCAVSQLFLLRTYLIQCWVQYHTHDISRMRLRVHKNVLLGNMHIARKRNGGVRKIMNTHYTLLGNDFQGYSHVACWKRTLFLACIPGITRILVSLNILCQKIIICLPFASCLIIRKSFLPNCTHDFSIIVYQTKCNLNSLDRSVYQWQVTLFLNVVWLTFETGGK